MQGGAIPEDHGNQAREGFLALLAKDPGRPHLPIYDEALALYRKRKTLHRICQLLVPGYTILSPREQKAARQRMDKGIKRAAQKDFFASEGDEIPAAFRRQK